MSHTYISWRALRYISKSKSVDWYWIVGFLTLLGSFLAYYVENPTFALVILVSGILVGSFKGLPNEPVEHKITHEGIQVGDTFYKYDDIKSFYVFSEKEGDNRLLLTLQQLFFTHVNIPLGSVDTDHVKNILEKHLRERRQKPTLADSVTEYLQL